jgi:hypothetical protein
MPYRSRKEIEADNLVLLGKLEAVRDELDEFLGDDEDESDNDDEAEEEAADEDAEEPREAEEAD